MSVDFRVTFDISKKHLGDIMDVIADYPMDNFSISKIKEDKPNPKTASKILNENMIRQNPFTCKADKKPSDPNHFRSVYAKRDMLPVADAILNRISHLSAPAAYSEIVKKLVPLGYHKPSIQTAFWRIKRQGKIKTSGNSRPSLYVKAA